MSGGHLNYFYTELQSHVGDFGDRELDELVKDLAELFYDREWYLSGDTDVGNWNEARDNFKKKWFTEIGRQDRIEKYLEDMTSEVRVAFGICTRYCRDCKHWTPTDSKIVYGKCEFVTSCLFHRCESCEKWDRRTDNV